MRRINRTRVAEHSRIGYRRRRIRELSRNKKNKEFMSKNNSKNKIKPLKLKLLTKSGSPSNAWRKRWKNKSMYKEKINSKLKRKENKLNNRSGWNNAEKSSTSGRQSNARTDERRPTRELSMWVIDLLYRLRGNSKMRNMGQSKIIINSKTTTPSKSSRPPKDLNPPTCRRIKLSRSQRLCLKFQNNIQQKRSSIQTQITTHIQNHLERKV